MPDPTRLTTAMPIRSAQISAVKILADGTRIDLGVLAYYHRNPLKRLLWRARRALSRESR